MTRRATMRIVQARRAVRSLAWVFLLAAFKVHAAQWFVVSGGAEVAFSPQFLTIQAGDSVTFLNLGGYHNVVADDGSFRCAHGCDGDGKDGDGNATSDLWIATVAFPTAGTVGYFCEPHGSPGEGMYGSIEVLAPPVPASVEPAPSGNPLLQLVLAAAIGALALFRLRRSALARARGKAPPRR